MLASSKAVINIPNNVSNRFYPIDSENIHIACKEIRVTKIICKGELHGLLVKAGP